MDQKRRMAFGPLILVLMMTAVIVGCTSKPITQPPEDAEKPSIASQSATQPVLAQPTASQAATAQPNQPSTEPISPQIEPYPSFALRTVSTGHWQIGPLSGWLGLRYAWFNDDTLLFSPGHPFSSVIDLQQDRILDPSPIPVPDMTIGSTTALSPDMRHLAYIRQGDLVIREVASGAEKVWNTGASPDAYSWHLWWSPNGRYLVGSWGAASGQPNTGKVWSLDCQTGEIRRLFDEPNRLVYFDGTWSPDGNQIVLRGGFPKGAFGVEFILVDVPSGVVTVAVPQNDQMYVERQFIWDDKGQLQVKNVLSGPNETRPVTYDRERNLYEDTVGEGRIRATELHFLTYERDVMLKIDLEPDLRAAGIPLSEKVLGHVMATMSPDGRWVLLTGYMGMGEDTRVAFCGAVEIATKNVAITTDSLAGGWAIYNGWSGSKALIRSQQQLAAYDLPTNKLMPVITGQEVYSAYSDTRGILYVGAKDIGIIRPDGSRDLVIAAGTDETFGMDHRLSPSGRYLVVVRRSQADDLDQETADILDLKRYGW